VFIFPVLEGKHGAVDLGKLDPANPDDRRLLLAADHDTRTGSPSAAGVGRHIEGHLAIADRLWRGAPPVLWAAAQKLLDSGEDRHLVLHALMEALEASAGDEHEFEATLRALATGLDESEFDDFN
jgi:enoyl-CoA hydratase/carnithine racemase